MGRRIPLTKNETRNKKSKKPLLVSVALGGILVMSAITYAGMSASSASSTFGGLGSAHEHATFLVMIDGVPLDFSQEKYQVASRYIHVENGVGTTMHKHATEVPVGEFFSSVNMQVTENCLITDEGSTYCSQGDKELKFYVNGMEANPALINRYIFSDDDRFLLYYGPDSIQAIQNAMLALDGIIIRP